MHEYFEMVWSEGLLPEYPKIVCKDFLPLVANDVNLISASGGIGKTFAALSLAMHFLKEHPSDEINAYIWATEDVPSLMKARELAVINQYMERQIDFRNETKRLCYGYKHTRFLEKVNGRYEPTEYFVMVMKELAAFGLVVFDPLLNFFGGDNENDNHQARAFMTLLKQAAVKYQTTFVIVHHGRKEDGSMRGASAFMDSVRLAYEFQREAGSSGVVARMTKTNYTSRTGDITLDLIPEPKHFPRESEINEAVERRDSASAQMREIRKSYGVDESDITPF